MARVFRRILSRSPASIPFRFAAVSIQSNLSPFVPDVTSSRSKEISSAVVRQALEGCAGGGGGGDGGDGGGPLRALCEALIRVAVAQPSRRHTMPRPRPPKVPIPPPSTRLRAKHAANGTLREKRSHIQP